MEHPEPLRPERCCLYIIDPQERLMAHIHEAERVSARICTLIHCARVLDIPILANTQYKKGIGPLVPEIAALLEGAPCPDKTEFNGLANSEVRQALEDLSGDREVLLVCGVETHICIYQSAAAALRAGYRPQVVADAVSSRDPANHELGLVRLRGMGVPTPPMEMVVYELLGRAGTPAFKAMLPHLR